MAIVGFCPENAGTWSDVKLRVKDDIGERLTLARLGFAMQSLDIALIHSSGVLVQSQQLSRVVVAAKTQIRGLATIMIPCQNAINAASLAMP
jgi:hypothetical protein